MKLPAVLRLRKSLVLRKVIVLAVIVKPLNEESPVNPWLINRLAVGLSQPAPMQTSLALNQAKKKEQNSSSPPTRQTWPGQPRLFQNLPTSKPRRVRTRSEEHTSELQS